MRFLVAVHHPEGYDPTTEGPEMGRDIDLLNDEMVDAGIRVFVGGLRPIGTAKAVRRGEDGGVTVSDGPVLKSGEHVAGFWVLEVADEAEALEWGRKAAVACRATIEVRAFN